MTDWQPMETAPRDGTTIYARTRDHREVEISWCSMRDGADTEDTEGWATIEDQGSPAAWSDGYFWPPDPHPIAWQPMETS